MCIGPLSTQLIGVPVAASLRKKYNKGQCFLALEVYLILGLLYVAGNVLRSSFKIGATRLLLTRVRYCI